MIVNGHDYPLGVAVMAKTRMLGGQRSGTAIHLVFDNAYASCGLQGNTVADFAPTKFTKLCAKCFGKNHPVRLALEQANS